MHDMASALWLTLNGVGVGRSKLKINVAQNRTTYTFGHLEGCCNITRSVRSTSLEYVYQSVLLYGIILMPHFHCHT
jgi:hypothetical protein